MQAFVNKAIADNSVVIFSKSYCPYCKKVKALFDSLGAAYTAIELDVVEGGSEIQQALTEKTNQRTVPNIFIKGQQIGGCDAVHSLHNEGKLKGML